MLDQFTQRLRWVLLATTLPLLSGCVTSEKSNSEIVALLSKIAVGLCIASFVAACIGAVVLLAAEDNGRREAAGAVAGGAAILALVFFALA